MSGAPNVIRCLQAFAGEVRGNVAIMFGLLLVPLLLATGMAIDFSRTGQAKAIIQEASDAALLRAAQMRSKNPNLTDADLSAIARRIFDAATAELADIRIDSFAVHYDQKAEAFRLDIGGGMKTTIMGVAGVGSLKIDVLSEVKLGDPPYLEVALALDNTGSMNQKGKLDDLKDSAAELVEALFQQPNAGVMVGLVPFAQYVNVGEPYDGASWLGKTKKGWKGCVGSRDYPANVEDSNYTSNPVPPLNGAPCPEAILELSTDKEHILESIEDMKGNGYTYIPSGLVWAWRLLTPNEPFSEGLTYDQLEKRAGIKSIVLLTDGENTRAPDYPTHNSGDHILADNLLTHLCANIKKDGIVIYTIAFDVSDALIRGLLEDCATTPGHYFDPSSDSELAAAFSNIGSSLRSLSLSK